MDLVTGYGDSDSEVEDGSGSHGERKGDNIMTNTHKNNTTIPPSDPSIYNGNSTVPSSATTTRKRRKKFDISILPIEIQHALTRGDTLKDSDDEDTTVTDPSALSADAKKLSYIGSNKSNCPLLSLLPNPKSKNSVEVGKHDNIVKPVLLHPEKSQVIDRDFSYSFNADDADYNIRHVNASETTTDKDRTAALKKSKSSFSFGYVTTEETRIDKNTTSSAVPSLGSSLGSDEDLDDDATTSVSTQKSANTPQGKVKSGVTPWFQAVGSRRTQLDIKPIVPDLTKPYSLATSSSGNYNAQVPVVDSSSVRVNHNEAYQQFYQEQVSEVQQQEKSNKKKRDRDIELQLLAGDLSALDNRPNTIRELDVDHTWDVQKYTDQQISEHEIRKGFGLGTTKSLMQVSKQQNRKHQLNSLAIKAAETELSLLEKRSHRMLTKSETQGKYGW